MLLKLGFLFLPVRFHLSCAEDTLATIEELAGGAMAELIEDEDKNASSTTYPTLTRYSFGIATFNSIRTLNFNPTNDLRVLLLLIIIKATTG